MQHCMLQTIHCCLNWRRVRLTSASGSCTITFALLLVKALNMASIDVECKVCCDKRSHNTRVASCTVTQKNQNRKWSYGCLSCKFIPCTFRNSRSVYHRRERFYVALEKILRDYNKSRRFLLLKFANRNVSAAAGICQIMAEEKSPTTKMTNEPDLKFR